VLLDAGADVHARDDLGLRLASWNGHAKVVKVLLTVGADVHAYDDEALQYASEYGHVEVVKVLLDAGANVHANDDSALRWASENGHLEVIKLLKQHGARKKKVNESIKHLKPRSEKEIRKIVFNSPPNEWIGLAHEYHIKLTHEQIRKGLEHESLYNQLSWAKAMKEDWLYDELYLELVKWAKRTDDLNNALTTALQYNYLEIAKILLKRAKRKKENVIDEENYAYAVSAGINILPYITEIPSPDFKFEKIGNQYYLIFNDWDDFSSYFKDNREISKQFIKEVLSGEGDEYFFGQYDSVNELPRYTDRFFEKLSLELFKDLKSYVIKVHKNAKKCKNFKDLYKYLQDLELEDKLDHNIRNAIIQANNEAYEMASYDQAYDELKNAIIKFFDISDIKYVDGIHKYKVKISESGLNTLIGLCFSDETIDKINYYLPQYGYSGNIEKQPDTFNDALANQLDNL